MGESFKAIIALLIVIALITAGLAWIDDRPNATTWGLRIGSLVVALLLVGFLVKLQFRKDLATDYLKQRCGTYFNRDGFCFAFDADQRDGVAYLTAFYQNQRDAALHGQIAIRPSRGFWMTRAKIDAITYDIHCEPGEFGSVSVPVPLPEKIQGKRQSFEVGASCKYVAGKGKRLRFRDGIHLRANSKFGNSFATALTLLGAAGGAVVLTRPAMAKIQLPKGVAVDDVGPATTISEVVSVYDPDLPAASGQVAG